jgi:hypothetical protein
MRMRSHGDFWTMVFVCAVCLIYTIKNRDIFPKSCLYIFLGVFFIFLWIVYVYYFKQCGSDYGCY